MSYTKPIARQNDVKRALDAARKSPVPVRSVDFTRPDGTRLSFVLDNGDPQPPPNELDQWIEQKKNAD